MLKSSGYGTRSLILGAAMLLAVLVSGSNADAATIQWTDWTTGSSATGSFVADGVITTTTTTVDVTYTNPQGVGFYQTGATGETDYWTQRRTGVSGRFRDADFSPYTSALVENIPTGTDIIALDTAGLQTLTFSQTIAHPVFSYVSLNSNGYAFDQDFEILSYGDDSVGNDIGYWGAGTSSKNIVDLGGGNFEYQLLGTGEPHGTIRFTGAFDTVTWRSLTNEYWNGFTVGIEGTAQEVIPPTHGVPLPSSLGMLGLGLFGLLLGRRLRRR